MGGYDNPGNCPILATRVIHDGAQRRPMQVVKMGVRDQYQVDRWKITNPQTRLAQALQNKQPWSKIWIDDNAQSGNLYEKAGVADKGNAQFTPPDKMRLVSQPGTWRNSRMAN